MLYAWEVLGGFEVMSREIGVTKKTLHIWRLGVRTPNLAMRDAVIDYMKFRVGLGEVHA